MIWGVMKMISSLRLELFSVLPMRSPRIGILLMPGTPSFWRLSVPLMRPPRSTVCELGTETLLVIERCEKVGFSVSDPEPAVTEDNCWPSSIVTIPDAVTRGFTVRITPVSRYTKELVMVSLLVVLLVSWVLTGT